MKNCFPAKKKKFLRFLEKEKVNPRELFELVDEACSLTSLPGFPLNTKMKAIQHGALASGDLRGFYSYSILLPGTVINR